MKRSLFSRFFLLFSLYLLTTLPLKASDQLEFSTITVEDGLLSNTILDMAQDQVGRIWFATYNGLTCFDGSSYHAVPRVILPGNNDVHSGKPEQIEVDRLGNIWVLFEGNRLVRLLDWNGRCQSYWDVSNKTDESFLLDLDQDGNLLLVSSDELWAYQSKEDRFARTTRTSYRSQAEKIEQVEQILEEAGFHAVVYSVTAHNQDWWVTTLDHGIFKIDRTGQSPIQNYTTNSGGSSAISSNEVYCLLIDKTGTIWVGTKDHGVNKGVVTDHSFTAYRSGELGIRNSSIRSILEDRNGNLWLGTYNQGVIVTRNGRSQTLTFSNEKQNKWNWIRSLHEDSEGYIWVGSYVGLCRVNPETLRVQYFKNSHNTESRTSEERVYSIVEDEKQNFYLGEWGALDYFDRSTNEFTRIDVHSDLKGRHIRKLLLDSRQRLWVGTEASGVYVLDTRSYQQLAHYKEEPTGENSLASNSIFDISEDEAGVVWIGSFGGLSSIDQNGQVHSYTDLNSSLPSPLIYRIVTGDDGLLWCSTTKGIVKVDPRSSWLRFYNRTDGVGVSEFSEGAACKDEQGRIYFGGIDGMTRFHPDSVRVNPYVPDVLLQSLTVNDKAKPLNLPTAEAQTAAFASWENDFSFHLKEVLLNSPHKNTIGWKLSPVDADFQYAQASEQELNYTDLPDGDYQLFVQSLNSDGIASPAKLVYEFRIATPFWKEYYFILGLLLLVAGLVLVVVRSRFSRIKKKNQKLEAIIESRTQKIESQKLELEKANGVLEERNHKVQAQKDQILAQRDHLLEMYGKLEESNRLKENFFANVSHDLRTPLSLIYAPACEMLKDPEVKYPIRKQLETIYSNTHYVLQLLDQVLDRKKLETGGVELALTRGDVVYCFASIVESFQVEAASNAVQLEFSSDVDQLNVRFDFGKLKQVIYNIVANAMKFTPRGGHIQCELQRRATGFEIEIRDTGIGIPADRIHHIFERYYQVGKSGASKEQGSGIGLSLVKEYVEILKGEITVASREGEGSTFYLKFPESLGETELVDFPSGLQPDVQARESEMLEEAENPAESTELVLVEDNRELQLYLKHFLSAHYSVKAFDNGLDAYNYLKSSPRVALVLSDWIMPEMDGIQLCQTMRKKDRLRLIPFILLTALGDINNEKEGYFAGIDDFVTKPFDPELLLLKIRRLLTTKNSIEKKARIELSTEPDNCPVETYDDKLLKRMMAIVEKEIANPQFDQNQLASEAGLSAMQLYRKLKELAHMTPSGLIRSVRMKRATQLLTNEKILVSEVSDLVGFNDPKYFARCFARETGKSPKAFREQFSNSN